MGEWVGELTANSYRLDGLADSSTGFDVSVWMESDDGPRWYFWGSSHINAATSADLIADRAAALKALWDGVLYVVYGPDYHPLRLSVLRNNDHQTVDWSLGDWSSDPFAPEIVSKRLGQVASYSDPLGNPVDLRLALARHDVGIRQRLQSLGKYGPDLTQLFKLYEDMTKTGKWDDARIDAEGEASGPVAERFRASVNNPAVSGAHSRHGGPGSKIPKAAPVTAREAAPVLLLAYRKYLLERAQLMDLRSLL